MRLALLGGTFDPVHCAHLAVARAAVASCDLDEVWLVPAGNPPHKLGQPRAPYADRLRMVELACNGDRQLRASDLEAGTERSYTYDTLRRVLRERPEAALSFVIGADAFAEIGTWHRWRQVVAMIEFIVVSRPGHDYAVPEGARVRRLDDVSLPVSSSALRARLAAGHRVAEVPAVVMDYIERHGLYRAAPGNA